MDSAPDIIGRALAGAFNATDRRYEVYDVYFKQLVEIYLYKFNLLKAMVSGIDAVDGRFQERIVTTVSGILGVPPICSIKCSSKCPTYYIRCRIHLLEYTVN